MLFPLLYLGTAGPNSVLIVSLLSYDVAFSLVAVTTKRNKQEKALIREMEAAEADKRRPSVIGARSRGSPPSVRLDRSDEAGVGDRQPVVGGLTCQDPQWNQGTPRDICGRQYTSVSGCQGTLCRSESRVKVFGIGWWRHSQCSRHRHAASLIRAGTATASLPMVRSPSPPEARIRPVSSGCISIRWRSDSMFLAY